MADKTRIIEISNKEGTFTSVFRKITGQNRQDKDYNLSDLSILRQLLSNEKAKLLHAIKIKHPKSLYSLAKMLQRDFKTVREEIILLKKFGFIELIQEKQGNRITHRPVITANSVNIIVRI